mmetsp:Transcript_31881/g.98470  ORF Transcript_31881/g.98470 Transcript_31881/m.98470 type:complete len:397 (-) Transcript_31881:643-1833(-)
MTIAPVAICCWPKKIEFQASPRAKCPQYTASCGTQGNSASPTLAASFVIANNCVGLETRSHMIGKTMPGGSQLGRSSPAYHAVSPATFVGIRTCCDAARTELLTTPLRADEPKTTTKYESHSAAVRPRMVADGSTFMRTRKSENAGGSARPALITPSSRPVSTDAPRTECVNAVTPVTPLTFSPPPRIGAATPRLGFGACRVARCTAWRRAVHACTVTKSKRAFAIVPRSRWCRRTLLRLIIGCRGVGDRGAVVRGDDAHLPPVPTEAPAAPRARVCARSQLHDACAGGIVADVRICLDNGAEIDGPDVAGFSPLDLASGHGVDVAALLLNRGAAVDRVTTEGGVTSLYSRVRRTSSTWRRCCSTAARTSTGRQISDAHRCTSLPGRTTSPRRRCA